MTALQICICDLAVRCARVQLETPALGNQGAGNAGCPMHPQARVRCRMAESTRGNHGHTGITRHSPRNGFTAYFVLFPATGFLATVVRAFANLTPASGCQNDTSSPYASAPFVRAW